MRWLITALATAASVLLPATATACTSVVSSVTAANTAVSNASPGATICLADGTYGALTMPQVKAAPGVTLAAQHPGQVTTGGITVDGQGLAVEDIKMAWLSVRNADRVRFQRVETQGGAWVGTGSTSVIPKNVSILDSILRPPIGAGEKDTLMAQRFKALRVEGNLMITAVEDGGHNDAFQSVWGGQGLIFKRNWIKGGTAQGFFLKDGAVTNLEFSDNLIAGRPGDGSSFADAPFQIYAVSPNSADAFYTGKTIIRNNTIWTNPNGAYIRETANRSLEVTRNVIDSWGAPDNNLSSVLANLTQDYNVIAGGNIGRRGANDLAGPPQFRNTTAGDWQLAVGSPGDFASGRAGITWDPTTAVYGPTVTGPPPPPPDRDGDGVPDASDACPDQPGTQTDGCPPPSTDWQAMYEAEKARADQLEADLAAMTMSRDNVQAIADAYKARVEAAEGKLAQIHDLSAP